jgi:hypothetical protein
VSSECFGHLTHMLMSLASGRLLLCLEGGYSLSALPKCVSACLRALLGDPLAPLASSLAPNPSALRTVEQVIRIHSQYWKCFGVATTPVLNKAMARCHVGLRGMPIVLSYAYA